MSCEAISKTMKCLVLILILSILLHSGLALLCYQCQTGYVTSETCSNQLPAGLARECNTTNSQCFESIQWFNDGALRLAMRGCWTPSENTTGGFCDNYQSSEGVLKYCRNCTEDFCNTDVLYYPVKVLNCYF